tara:strand:+ start:907 stop:1071 length:165 start_codon:yes stop_codon:yes gene_type:complete
MKYFKCVICHKQTKGYGNNSAPLNEGLCCDKCNQKFVIPRRLAELDDFKVGGTE